MHVSPALVLRILPTLHQGQSFLFRIVILNLGTCGWVDPPGEPEHALHLSRSSLKMILVWFCCTFTDNGQRLVADVTNVSVNETLY